jgi:hypothetical protein
MPQLVVAKSSTPQIYTDDTDQSKVNKKDRFSPPVTAGLLVDDKYKIKFIGHHYSRIKPKQGSLLVFHLPVGISSNRRHF